MSELLTLSIRVRFMFDVEIFETYLQKIQQKSPLVHCMTNDVVSNFTANILLAIGATPAMVVAVEEVEAFVQVADALLINVGTLTADQAQAMTLAVQVAHRYNKPWVLDPVAFGALGFRSDFCRLLLTYKPTVIRGNPSEIAALAGMKVNGKGPDSLIGSDEALEAAQQLARDCQSIVALTGAVDYVTDGVQTYALKNGSVQLTRVTGTGCALGAMVAAYCSICETPMIASACALSHMAIAGELAGEHTHGIGSFAVALLDQLQGLHDSEMAIKRLNSV